MNLIYDLDSFIKGVICLSIASKVFLWLISSTFV